MFFIIEFGFLGKFGGFYEEGGVKEVWGFVKEGGKGWWRVENERCFLVFFELGGVCGGGVLWWNKGMKGCFVLDVF